MDTPWKIIKLDIKNTPDGQMTVANLPEIVPGFIASSPRIFWVVNAKAHHIFMGGHYHPVGTKMELLAPLVKNVEFELHSSEACEVVNLDPSKNEALLVPCGVEHLARISPGGIVMGAASTLEQDGECRDRINCRCRSGRG